MLQQILKDMYIDPDVLEALNDDQKKTLFMKMREEQVRRWKEREEKLEGEGGAALKTMPKKGQRKTVSWLLGRDGDVQVCVIGDADEIRPSKLICSQLEEQKVSNLHSNTRPQMGLRGNFENRGSSELVRTGTERLSPTAQTGIQLHLKGDQSASNVQPNHIFQVSQTEQGPPSTEEIEDDDDDDDPSSAADDTRLYYRPHLRFSDTPSIADRLRPLISQEPNGDPLSITDRLRHQDSQEMEKGTGKDLHTVSAFRRAGLEAVADGEPSVARGRVAQLMKNFGTPSSSSNSTTPRRKPPVPNKPPHLLASTSPR